jgi:hypothetical protein
VENGRPSGAGYWGILAAAEPSEQQDEDAEDAQRTKMPGEAGVWVERSSRLG